MAQNEPTSQHHRVAVISASQRSDRMGPVVADWVHTRLSADVDLIDLAEVDLPGEHDLAPGGSPPMSVTGRLADADAFVFVFPEYNHSIPASLKRLIDWHHGEWALKAATIVAYGVQGGYSAIEHLRGVLAELNMVTTRRVLGLRAPWEHTERDRYRPDEGTDAALNSVLAEFAWWTDLLADARRTRPFPG